MASDLKTGTTQKKAKKGPRELDEDFWFESLSSGKELKDNPFEFHHFSIDFGTTAGRRTPCGMRDVCRHTAVPKSTGNKAPKDKLLPGRASVDNRVSTPA